VFKHSDCAQSDTDMPVCNICCHKHTHTHTPMFASSDTDMAACNFVFKNSDTTKASCDISVYAHWHWHVCCHIPLHSTFKPNRCCNFMHLQKLEIFNIKLVQVILKMKPCQVIIPLDWLMWFRALRGMIHYSYFNFSSTYPETSVRRKLILSGCMHNDQNYLLTSENFWHFE
jgi:hypothetical protein